MAIDARLNIEIIAKEGRSFLKNQFCTQPFKIADVTENRSGVLRLVLMSSSPGVLDGDTYKISIALGQGSAMQLQTQSYQRLFTMKAAASQSVEVVMEPGSSFRYLPHPVVPHRNTNFSSSNRIFLSAGCKILWGEVFTCGRKLNGEVFQFTSYRALTEIFLSGRLIIKENVVFRPAVTDFERLGQLEGYTHQATLICLDETMDVKRVAERVCEKLGSFQGIEFGVTDAPANGFIVRLLGHKAEQLFDILKMIGDQV